MKTQYIFTTITFNHQVPGGVPQPFCKLLSHSHISSHHLGFSADCIAACDHHPTVSPLTIPNIPPHSTMHLYITHPSHQPTPPHPAYQRINYSILYGKTHKFIQMIQSVHVQPSNLFIEFHIQLQHNRSFIRRFHCPTPRIQVDCTGNPTPFTPPHFHTLKSIYLIHFWHHRHHHHKNRLRNPFIAQDHPSTTPSPSCTPPHLS